MSFTGEKKNNSLSSSLKRVIFGTVIVVVISFLAASYFVVERERVEYGKRESQNVLRNLSNNIDSQIESYASLTRLIMTEPRLLEFLRADVDAVDIRMINDARYGIMDILNVTEGVDSVIVFREDMIMINTNRFTYNYNYDLMNTESWKQDMYERKGAWVTSLNINNIAYKADNRPLITVGRAIYDIDSQERTGILMMNISTVVLDRMLAQLRDSGICIMGTDGTFLAGNREYVQFYDSSFAGKEITTKAIRSEGKRLLVSGCRVGDNPIVILRSSEYANAGIPFRMIYVLLILMAMLVFIAFCIGLYIRKHLTDPVINLSSEMEKNRQSGDLQKIDAEMPNSELALLESDYNNMIDHVNELIATLMEKEKTLQKAELRVLQEQIKPHFLYNSIETIGFMALDAGADKVHDALETMGSFYRNFLSKGGREISLSREVRIVKDYLALQKLRYGDIIEDVYEIDPEAEEFIVPKLILQPLVENSIYHGIRMKGEKGTISIRAFLQEDETRGAGELHIIVTDTGVGMEQQVIDKILSPDSKDRPAEADESFGLWGTIERIRMYTGVRDCVRIDSEIGEFTRIEITIPDMFRT